MTNRLVAADPQRKGTIYEAFGPELTYHHKKRIVTVESQPALTYVHMGCVRGGT